MENSVSCVSHISDMVVKIIVGWAKFQRETLISLLAVWLQMAHKRSFHSVPDRFLVFRCRTVRVNIQWFLFLSEK